MRVLNIKKTRKTRGGLYPGGGGGLITGCIFLFTGRWAYNPGGLISRGRLISRGGLISGSLRYAYTS